MALQGFGISVVLLAGWDGRIFTHAGDEDSDNRPTLHMSSFPLPVDEGDFGFDVIAGMAASGIFVSLVEYTPDCYLPEVDLTTDPSAIDLNPSGTVFGSIGIPVVHASDFDQAVVVAETTLPAITAVQYPFTAAGRPFVLYVVVGDEANLSAAVGQVNALLDTLVISPAMTVKFQGLNVAFLGDPFPGLINIGSLRGQGPCRGTGTATAALARSDGGSSQSFTATLAFNGTYQGGTDCINSCEIAGTLTVALSDGRIVDVPISFDIPTMAAQSSVGVLNVTNDPITLPAAFSLDTICSANSVLISGAFVTLLNLLGDLLQIPAGAVPVSGSSATVPVQWNGAGIGQGSLAMYELGAQAAAVRVAGLRRRQLLARRRFTIRGHLTKKVVVHLGVRARRLLRTRRKLAVALTLEVRDAHGMLSSATRIVTLKAHSRRRSGSRGLKAARP